MHHNLKYGAQSLSLHILIVAVVATALVWSTLVLPWATVETRNFFTGIQLSTRSFFDLGLEDLPNFIYRSTLGFSAIAVSAALIHYFLPALATMFGLGPNAKLLASSVYVIGLAAALWVAFAGAFTAFMIIDLMSSSDFGRFTIDLGEPAIGTWIMLIGAVTYLVYFFMCLASYGFKLFKR